MSYNSLVTYVLEGNGRTSFPLPFPFDQSVASLEIWLDGAKYTGAWTYDSVNKTTVFSVAPNGIELLLKRNTNVSSRSVTFNARSMLSETELNRSIEQLFFAVQEAQDMLSYTVSGQMNTVVSALDVKVEAASDYAEAAAYQVVLAAAQVTLATTEADRAHTEADRAEVAANNAIVDIGFDTSTTAVMSVATAAYPLGGSISTLRIKPPASPVAGTRYALTYLDGVFAWNPMA